MTRHIKPNEWKKRYGAARRAIDRALLEKIERQIDSQFSIEDGIHEAIAREFADRSALTTSSRPS
jgi:hypothetical protein